MPVKALAFRNKKNTDLYLYIGIDATDRLVAIDKMRQSLKMISPKTNFKLTWLDEDFERSNSQTATISLLGYLSFMVVAIATLGLTGLVIYTVEVKRKEISIRKILGQKKNKWQKCFQQVLLN